MRYLDITAVAKQSGVAASALRYYEEKGLIASVGRRGLRCLFDAAVRDGLRHAAVCPAPSHMECPSFRRLLQVAAGLRDGDGNDASARRGPKSSPLASVRTTSSRRS